MIHVAINTTTQIDMAAAVNHPIALNQGLKVSCVMTRGLVARFIITKMTGAIKMPLITALQ